MRFDVAIIGAGTAGAGAAWQCARRGLRVVCLDARPLAEAGALPSGPGSGRACTDDCDVEAHAAG
ncbi:MAG: FAD-dependent oxidoreductase [Enhygromyxa sp.]